MSVACLPGRANCAVSASQDRTLKIWDVDRGTAVQTMTGHTSDVLGVAVTPDGGLIVSAGDTTLRIWDSATGTEIASWEAHFPEADCVGVSPNGDKLLSGGAEGIAKLWNLRSRELIHEFRLDSPVLAVAISPDGSRALAGTADGAVFLLDLDRKTAKPTGPRHRGFVRAVAFTRDQRWAIAGGLDGVTTVWDPSGANAQRLNAGRGAIGAVLELPGGTLAVSSVDGSIVLWRWERGEATKTIQASDGPIGALAVLDDGRIVTGSGDRTLRVIRPTASVEAGPSIRTGPVTGLAMNDTGDTAFSAAADRSIRVWDPRTGEQRGIRGNTAGPVSCLAVACHGKTIVTFTTGRWLSVWEGRDRNHEDTSWELDEAAAALALTPDGRRAVLAGVDDIRVVSLDDGSIVQRLPSEASSGFVPVAVTVTAAGLVLVLAFTADIYVIDLETGSKRQLVGPPGYEGFLFKGAIAVDRSGERAASVAIQRDEQRVHDNPIWVWDLNTGKVIRELHGHTGWVLDIAFRTGAPGRSSQDGSVRVWDLDKGTTVAWFGTDERLQSVATDRSGARIAAGASHGAVHFFHLETATRSASRKQPPNAALGNA